MALNSKSIEAQIATLLDDYSKEVKEKTDKAFEQVAKEAAQELRQTSPRGKGKNSGDYAKGWTVKRERDKKSGLYTITVHNKTHYQLTHLLENGHDVVRGGVVVGHAKAYPHIADVNDWAIQAFESELYRRLKEK